MAEITRRHFFFGSAALLSIAAAPRILVPEKKVQRFWQVGVGEYSPAANSLFQDQAASGMMPIYGQPGLFRDLRTNQVINIRDFNESDKFSTIIIPTTKQKFRVNFR